MPAEKGVVLVADDEPFNLEILQELLTAAGYGVVLAENGAEAWNLIQAEHQRYAVALLDRMMPGMDGLELLARIRHGGGAMASLPVILQTARAAASEIDEGLRAGAFGYLSKPFGKEQLLRMVEDAVADRRSEGFPAADSGD